MKRGVIVFGCEDFCDTRCERCPTAVFEEREGIGNVDFRNATPAETSLFFWDAFAGYLKTSGP